MSKYVIRRSAKFKKDYKRCKKRGLNMSLLDDVIIKLANGEKLDQKYRDHALAGNYKGYRDCHIAPDWLLIYKIDGNKLILMLSETGTHSDLIE